MNLKFKNLIMESISGADKAAELEVWRECQMGRAERVVDPGFNEFDVFSPVAVEVREFVAAVYDDGGEGNVVIPEIEGFSPSTFA